MVISNHIRPPDLMMEAAAAYMRDKSRVSPAFAEIINEIERRFGDIEDLFKRLDFVSVDSAYLLQPQKDGTYEPVVHNIRHGQLATALERGFLPLALADYKLAIETKEQVRMNSGERSMLPVGSQRKPRPFKCEECGTSLTSKRRLNSHMNKKHGGSQ